MGLFQEKGKNFKRQVIAEAAYELLTSKPYEAVTVDDIARRSGCGKGTLYMHFENKDTILTYLMCQGLDDLCSEMAKCQQNTDIKEAISDYITLQYEFYINNHQLIASWLSRKLSNNLSADWVEKVHAKLEHKVQMAAEMLAQGIKQNKIIPLDSYNLADYLENLARAGAISYIEGVSLKGNKEKSLALIKDLLAKGIYTTAV